MTERLRLVQEIMCSQDDDMENIINWASAFLGRLTMKQLKIIHERETKKEGDVDE